MTNLAVRQIEFYFTVENLCRDIFMRSYMDEEVRKKPGSKHDRGNCSRACSSIPCPGRNPAPSPISYCKLYVAR